MIHIIRLENNKLVLFLFFFLLFGFLFFYFYFLDLDFTKKSNVMFEL